MCTTTYIQHYVLIYLSRNIFLDTTNMYVVAHMGVFCSKFVDIFSSYFWVFIWRIYRVVAKLGEQHDQNSYEKHFFYYRKCQNSSFQKRLLNAYSNIFQYNYKYSQCITTYIELTLTKTTTPKKKENLAKFSRRLGYNLQWHIKIVAQIDFIVWRNFCAVCNLGKKSVELALIWQASFKS